MEMVGSRTQTTENDTESEIIGILLAFGCCTATASLVVFQKPLLSKYDSQLLCAVYYGTGTCFAVSVYILLVALPPIAMKNT